MSVELSSTGNDSKTTLDDLRKCQRDIVTIRHECDRRIDEIERVYSENVKPYLSKRNSLIEGIPRFWSRSILNHPLISTVLEPGEADVLTYLSSLEVEEDPKHSDLFKIHFTFDKNPYFDNRILTKEFKENGSLNVPVRWKKGKQFPRLTKHDLWEDDDLGLECKGFFRWYYDPNEQHCDPIADIVRTCVWYNPMEFYDEKKSLVFMEDQQEPVKIPKEESIKTIAAPPERRKSTKTAKKTKKSSSRSEV